MADFGFDTSILTANFRRPPAQQTVAEQQKTLADVAQTRMQNQVGQANLAQLLYSQQRQKSLADIVQQGAGAYGDPMAHAYAAGGFGPEAAEAQAQAAQRAMSAAKLMDIHADLMRSQASTIKTPEQYGQWLSRMPTDVRSMYGLPDKYDAGAVQGFIGSGISPEKQAELENKRNELNKGRYHLVPNPVTGSMRKIDELTGDVTPVEATGIGASDGQVPAPPGSKIATYKEGLLNKLGEDLDPTKGKSNLPAKAQAQIAAAERFEQLLDAPGPMTNQRLHEATMMAATIANGGNQPTEAMVESMFPKTLKGKSTDFWQSLLNTPMDAGAGAFVDLLRNQSERETTLAKKQIQQYMLNRLSKHPQAFQEFQVDANRMAEAAGLKGLYDPKTLLPLKPSAHTPQELDAARKWLADTKKGTPEQRAKVKAILQEAGGG